MNGLDIARIALSVLMALLLVATGGGKVARASSSHRIRDELRVSASTWWWIGVFELITVAVLVAGIWVPSAAATGAAAVVALMLGAIITRVRAGGAQRRAGVLSDAAVGVLAIAALVVAVSSA